MKYPHLPKSTAYLEPGQFWPISLSNGRYACGIVLAKLEREGKVETRVFYAGLLDWCSDSVPTSNTISKCGVIKRGALHIKAIREVQSKIIGKANFSNMPKSPAVYTDNIITMGYSVLSVVAEGRFVSAANK